MTQIETDIEITLKTMRRKKEYIVLSLWPAIGDTTIRREGNRLYINEGRDGKWDNVDELFYDLMVERYDSRCRK